MNIIEVLKSNYCKTVFGISLLISYFLLPSRVFYGIFTLLAVAFMVLFSLSVSCIVRNIKEKAKSLKSQGGSILSLIASIFGISAFQVCTVGAPVCGATLGTSILSLFFPSFFVGVMKNFAIPFIFVSIIFQFFALYIMKCFENFKSFYKPQI